MNKRKNVAVVGAGIFGCTIALVLSKKFDVDLYERKSDILNEASMCNQFRFHEGYHYPRSQKTVNEIKKSNKSFERFYGINIFKKTKNFYAVAKKNSKTSFINYINFLNKNKFNYKIIKKSEYISEKITGTVLSDEKTLNYFKLKKIILFRLKKSNINLKLNSQLDKNILRYKSYNKIILSTYKNNNNILKKLGCKIKNKFRYELVEKIGIKLPKKYSNLSFVVMDGNFLCLDPYVGTSYHLLSHVKHSKIKIIKNISARFPKKYDDLLIKTKINNLKISRFQKFVKDGKKFLPFLKFSKYIFSFFVVRTIKANVEKSSDRTNLVQNYNNKIITVMSGKWNTCVTEAKKIEKLIS